MNIFRKFANPGKQVNGETDISFAGTAKNVSPKELASAVFRKKTIRTFVHASPFLRLAASNLLGVKNPVAMTVAMMKNRDKTARFKDGNMLPVTISNHQEYEMEKDRIRHNLPVLLSGGVATFNYNGRDLSFDLANSCCNALKETFFLKVYRRLNFEGRIVLDIGANVGDTATYFALEGARKVIALEPYPQTYEVAARNISRNKMAGEITLLNAGIGGSESSVLVDTGFKSNGSSPLREFDFGKKVPIVTIDRLVEEYGLEGAVMKLDCEGGEYSAILGSAKLAAFDEIILEYHYGYRNIKKKLEREGFSVELVGAPTYSYNVHADHHHFILGLLHAKKKSHQVCEVDNMLGPIIYAKVEIAKMKALSATKKEWPMAKERLLEIVGTRYDVYGPHDAKRILNWATKKMGVTSKGGKKLLADAPKNKGEWQLLEEADPKKAAKIKKVKEQARRLKIIEKAIHTKQAKPLSEDIMRTAPA